MISSARRSCYHRQREQCLRERGEERIEDVRGNKDKRRDEIVPKKWCSYS